MSILIKGMEMPLRCINCPFENYYHGENRCLANRGKTIEWEIGHDRGRDCPLLPLPEGHGRLGDLDALFEVMGQDTDRWLIDDISYIETDDAISAVYKAPTIVPAEGGTDDAPKTD